MASPTQHGIGFEELAEYFHLPITQVSKELGVCATVLKKICRKNGIPRWPHRKIKSLDRMIKALESTVTTTVEEQARVGREIEEMKAKKLTILKNPNNNTEKYKPGKSKKSKDNCEELKFQPYSPPKTRHDDQNDIAVVSEIMTNIKARRFQKEEVEASKPQTQPPLMPIASIVEPSNNNVLPSISAVANQWPEIRIAPLMMEHQPQSRPYLPVLEPCFNPNMIFKF